MRAAALLWMFWMMTMVPAAAGPANADTQLLAEAATPTDPSADPAAEFAARVAQLAPGATDEAIELAQWAAKHGLLDESDSVYRAVLHTDPANDAAYYELWHLNRARDLPVESRPYRDARERLPAEFVEYETRRYVIFSDSDPAWIRVQGRRLERTYDQFVSFVLRAGLRALPPRHKLVAVVFEERADFLELAEADGTGGRIAGYYRQPEDRLVFYHVESNANIADAREQLEQQRAEIESLHHAARRAGVVGRRNEARTLRERRDEQLRLHDARSQRIEDFARRQSVSVTVHEAIHQLMFHTGVQSRFVQHPLWLTEGLATSFETDTPTMPFGPRYDYIQRRRGFYAILDQGRLLPLRRLVVASPSELMAIPTVLYHQSYALVSWMALHRKREFRDYLERLNALPRGVPSPDTQLATFEAAFGDLERLEQIWLRYEIGGS